MNLSPNENDSACIWRRRGAKEAFLCLRSRRVLIPLMRRRFQFSLGRFFVATAAVTMVAAMIAQGVHHPEDSLTYVLIVGFIVAGTVAGLLSDSVLRGVSIASSLLVLLLVVWFSYPLMDTGRNWVVTGLDLLRWRFIAP